MSLPTVTIVGRPNVGKSTFFNVVTKGLAAKAIISHIAGTTRDWKEGTFTWKGMLVRLIDTAGEPGNSTKDTLSGAVREAIRDGISKADLILLMLEARGEITTADRAVERIVRSSGKPWLVVVNKSDQPANAVLLAPYLALGPAVYAVSSTRRHGIPLLLNAIVSQLKKSGHKKESEVQAPLLRIAIVGRPNVGKSTLLNALSNSKRAVVSPTAGTTRDPVEAVVSLGKGSKELAISICDTAGIGRRGRILAGVEKQSVKAAELAIIQSNLVLVVVDFQEGPTRGDAHIAALAHQHKKPIIVVYTKKDLVDQESGPANARHSYMGRFPFMARAQSVVVSGETGENIELLRDQIANIANIK